MIQKSAFGLAGKNSKTGSDKYSKPPKPEGVKMMKSGISGLSENQKSPIKPKPEFEKSTLSQKSPKSDISKKSGPHTGLASKPKLQDTASNQSHRSNTPEKSVDTAKLISYTQSKKSLHQTQPQTSSPAILSKQAGLQQKLTQFRVNEDTSKTKKPTTTATTHDSPKKIQNFVNSEIGVKIDHLFIKQWDNQKIGKKVISNDGSSLGNTKGGYSKSLEKTEEVIEEDKERKRSVEKLNLFRKAEGQRRSGAEPGVGRENGGTE
jgi:hypothetical protein